MLGLTQFLSGDVAGAIRPLQRSVQIDPGALRPHLLLAEALASTRHPQEAKSEWNAALKIDPHSPQALDGLGRELIGEGKSEEAIALLRSGPSNEDLTADLAQAYSGLRMFDEATKELKAALAKSPNSLRLANALASVYLQALQYQAAEKLCHETLQEHPNDLPTEKLYLQAVLLGGNRAVSRPLGKKLLRDAPRDFDLLFANGVMEYDDGEIQGARDHLREALTINPHAFAVHYRLGLALQQLNDAKGAQEQFQDALNDGATEPELHLQLAKALRSLGQNEPANAQLKLYQQSLQDQHNRALAMSKSGQGDKAMSSGDAHSAATFYREALAATPDDAQLNIKLAAALDTNGDFAGERAALDKAVELHPNLAAAHNQLGLLSSQSGDPVEAEKHFREAVRAAPQFTEAWVNLAAALGLQSRFTEAQEAVDNALRLEPKNPQALLLRDTLAKAKAQH